MKVSEAAIGPESKRSASEVTVWLVRSRFSHRIVLFAAITTVMFAGTKLNPRILTTLLVRAMRLEVQETPWPEGAVPVSREVDEVVGVELSAIVEEDVDERADVEVFEEELGEPADVVPSSRV